MQKDERAFPEYGERVPVVVVYRGPDARLIDQVVSPEEFHRQRCRINTEYYIQKQVLPGINRMLKLMGVELL